VALNDDDRPQFTPAEIRRNRIQVVLILVPVLFTIAVIVIRAIT
jgi:hypothetical protein